MNKKEDKKSLIAIILLSAVILIESCLLVYVIFFYNPKSDSNNDNSKDNNVINKELTKTIAESYIEKVVEKSMESRYLNYSDSTWKSYSIYSILSDINPINKENNDIYKCSEEELLSDNGALCYFGLTESEYNKVDKSLFTNMNGGSLDFRVYKLQDIKDNLIKAYGTYSNLFENSFKESYTDCQLKSAIYDVNLDKVFIRENGGCDSKTNERNILKGYSEDDKYYVEYTNENISQFNKHTAIFEKDNNVYKYVETK